MSNSPAAYTDAETGKLTALPPQATMVVHEYRPLDDGGIEHWMSGRLCATVPAEGLADYARVWPDCAELVAAQQRPAGKRGAAIDADPIDQAEQLSERIHAATAPAKTPAFLKSKKKSGKKKR